MKHGVGQAWVRSRLRARYASISGDSSIRSTRPEAQHVFVALAADYGNLGDLAITQAQATFLRRRFPDAVVEGIPISRSLEAIKHLREVSPDTDVITLIGGGNTGNMYDDIQYLRELWVTSFPSHRVISFPQTVRFSEDVWGRMAARRAANVYRAHPRLRLLARDQASLSEAQRRFSGLWAAPAPDVVLTLTQDEPVAHREGILIALRDDQERGLDPLHRERLIAELRDETITFRDTHVGDVRLTSDGASAELNSVWSAYRHAEVVLTDRLHGMIFAIITNTPCVALDSGTGKVGQFHRDWLQSLPGVRLLAPDAPEKQVAATVQEARTMKLSSADYRHVRAAFDEAFEKALE
jgi:pyruvyl transferase EpsI